MRRVVHVVVGRHGAPGRGAAVDDGQEGQDRPGEGGARDRGRGRVVGVFSRLAEDDHEDDEVNQPGVALVDEDGIQPDKADDQRHHRDHNDAHHQRDVSVRHGRQRQPTRDARHGGPADLLDGVERGDQLVGPPAEAEAGDRDLAQTCRGAKRRRIPGDAAAEQRAEDGDQDRLLEAQPELPPQKPRREARRVHRPRRPQQRHRQLLVPPHRPLVFGPLALNRLRLNPQLRVHARLKPAELREDPIARPDRRVVVQQCRRRFAARVAVDRDVVQIFFFAVGNAAGRARVPVPLRAGLLLRVVDCCHGW